MADQAVIVQRHQPGGAGSSGGHGRAGEDSNFGTRTQYIRLGTNTASRDTPCRRAQHAESRHSVLLNNDHDHLYRVVAAANSIYDTHTSTHQTLFRTQPVIARPVLCLCPTVSCLWFDRFAFLPMPAFVLKNCSCASRHFPIPGFPAAE